MSGIMQLFPQRNLFRILLFIAAIFFTGYFIPVLNIVGLVLLVMYLVLLIVEVLLLFWGKVLCGRQLSSRFFCGEKNTVRLHCVSSYPFSIRAVIVEELPVRLQIRDFEIKLRLSSGEQRRLTYTVIPVRRGEYHFGKTHVFIHLLSRSICRRVSSSEGHTVSVYPSFPEMKKADLHAFSQVMNRQGAKKERLPGTSKEFEEISDYIPGDNYRWINWKATARRSKLMVNRYQDERARDIYQIIDMGRTMKMPFDGMTLLDYSINSALALSNVILKKHDKAGLITYHSRLNTFIKADNRSNQLTRLCEALYAQESQFPESSLDCVYTPMSRNSRGRSLIILYSNFESPYALERESYMMKKLAAKHMVLLISFINTDILQESKQSPEKLEQLYAKTVAGKFLADKQMFMKKLHQKGINTIMVKPKDLTIAVLNKYLDIRKKGF